MSTKWEKSIMIFYLSLKTSIRPTLKNSSLDKKLDSNPDSVFAPSSLQEVTMLEDFPEITDHVINF